MDKKEYLYSNKENDLNLDINFWTSDAYIETTLSPVPAIDNLPKWWKDRPLYQVSNNPLDLYVLNNNGVDAANISIKHCMPYFDALTAGYHYRLPTNVYVSKTENENIPSVTWDEDDPRPIEMRGHLEIPVPSGCYPIHFVWDMRWGTKTPEGWSLMITHPLGRWDLPFITMTAIQDADRWSTNNVVTFFLRKDFEGVIPKGTPIMSLIPYKRANWQMNIDHAIMNEATWDLERKRNYIYGFYKKHRWIRKKYR